MDRPRIPVFRALRDARRREGLTQQQLADRVGASQSAISMFESGRLDALARAKVEAIARELGVDLEQTVQEPVPREGAVSVPALWFCPSSSCLGSLPVVIKGELRFLPAIVRAAAEAPLCPWCAERLLSRCDACGCSVGEGVFCIECREPLVNVPAELHALVDLPRWVETEGARRQQIIFSARTRDYPPMKGGRHADTGETNG